MLEVLVLCDVNAREKSSGGRNYLEPFTTASLIA